MLVFVGRRGSKNGQDTEKLRWWQNTTDSSAVLVLVRKGPLGGVFVSWGFSWSFLVFFCLFIKELFCLFFKDFDGSEG